MINTSMQKNMTKEVFSEYRSEMMENEQKEGQCPVSFALRLIGGKWKLPILWALSCKGVLRYNELRRCVCGITNMMLSQSLRELEQNGLVRRIQYMEIPPHVEYSLTPSGESLMPALNELAAWGTEQMHSAGLKNSRE